MNLPQMPGGLRRHEEATYGKVLIQLTEGIKQSKVKRKDLATGIRIIEDDKKRLETQVGDPVLPVEQKEKMQNEIGGYERTLAKMNENIITLDEDIEGQIKTLRETCRQYDQPMPDLGE